MTMTGAELGGTTSQLLQKLGISLIGRHVEPQVTDHFRHQC